MYKMFNTSAKYLVELLFCISACGKISIFRGTEKIGLKIGRVQRCRYLI